jgi:hypothetical protein
MMLTEKKYILTKKNDITNIFLLSYNIIIIIFINNI